MKIYKIGINALYVKSGVNGGTETYFDNIVRPWYESPKKGVQFLLLANNAPSWWAGERPWFKIKTFPAAKSVIRRLVTEQFFYPFYLRRKIDLLFNPGYVGSYLTSCPQVSAVHDAFAWIYPREIGFLRGMYWRLFIPLTGRKAERVIAVSENTARDIGKHCGISGERIEVIHAGGVQHPITPASEILERYGLAPGSYFHTVGFFKEIKNPFRIIAAFRSYKATNPASFAKLVLVGHVGGRSGKKILRLAQETEDIVYVGRLSDSELVALYRNSLGLVFPSLYEGFGIPIVEAQEYGCPVITGNVSAMPEVAGNGAIIVNPLNVDEIADAFKKLEYGDNSDLVAAGYLNVRRFSWQVASNETLDLLKSVLGGMS